MSLLQILLHPGRCGPETLADRARRPRQFQVGKVFGHDVIRSSGHENGVCNAVRNPPKMEGTPNLSFRLVNTYWDLLVFVCAMALLGALVALYSRLFPI